MSDVFQFIDRCLPSVRLSVRKSLAQKIRNGAVIASVRGGNLHIETFVPAGGVSATQSMTTMKRKTAQIEPAPLASAVRAIREIASV